MTLAIILPLDHETMARRNTGIEYSSTFSYKYHKLYENFTAWFLVTLE